MKYKKSEAKIVRTVAPPFKTHITRVGDCVIISIIQMYKTPSQYTKTIIKYDEKISGT